MTKPYSEDLRLKVIQSVEGGLSRRATAARFDVSESFVIKLMRRFKAEGTHKARQYGGWKKAALAGHRDWLSEQVAQKADITIAELLVLLTERGIRTSRAAIGRALLGLGLTHKKRRSTPPSRREPTSPPPASAGGRNSRT